jgi:hypothetical protein
MKKILALAVVTMLFAATAFAATGEQTGNNDQWNQMYQYCNQMMQSWGNGKASDQSGNTQTQGQQTSYNGSMPGNGMMGSGMMNGQGHMMGNGNYGNMMGNGQTMGNGNYGGMMGSGGYGNMMSVVEFH